jgi:hypothetical protein
MKYLFYFSLFISVLSCSKSNGVENNLEVPVLLTPADNSFCIDSNLRLSWRMSEDQDLAEVTYLIQVSDQENFSSTAKEYESQEAFRIFSFEKDQTYYWRVCAVVAGQRSKFSSPFQFYTEGTGAVNYIPFTPVQKTPLQDQLVGSGEVLLSWTANDQDVNDPLVYDVYFGTREESIEKIKSDGVNESLTITTESSQTYYWKVVSKDNRGGEATSDVWSFKTE